MFEKHLKRWNLTPEGSLLITRTAQLLPVRQNGKPAMLKIGTDRDERRGGALMEWWNGDGAARVLARDGDALLLERAAGAVTLAELAHAGRDDEACRILCDVAARLHAPRAKPLPEFVPLARWFRELGPAAEAHGGILVRSAEIARKLLDEPHEIVALHGDLHHGNVLDFGDRGWLAIDPKGLLGERGFDFANIFTNPDMDDPTRPLATKPDRFLARVAVVAGAANLERERLLRWILAWSGLSAAWLLTDGADAAVDFEVAKLAAAELDR